MATAGSAPTLPPRSPEKSWPPGAVNPLEPAAAPCVKPGSGLAGAGSFVSGGSAPGSCRIAELLLSVADAGSALTSPAFGPFFSSSVYVVGSPLPSSTVTIGPAGASGRSAVILRLPSWMWILPSAPGW